ncbi:hypothetical protein G9A89_005952 [Geosiphon pyriformis]|nr:hypothetical protein G9A89_005952 [Geosiphon pyriformis]
MPTYEQQLPSFAWPLPEQQTSQSNNSSTIMNGTKHTLQSNLPSADVGEKKPNYFASTALNPPVVGSTTLRNSENKNNSGDGFTNEARATGTLMNPDYTQRCVQAILDLNEELFRVCIDYQSKGLLNVQEIEIYKARLQSNLTYLATVADQYTNPQGELKQKLMPDFSPLPTPRFPSSNKINQLIQLASQVFSVYNQQYNLVGPSLLKRDTSNDLNTSINSNTINNLLPKNNLSNISNVSASSISSSNHNHVPLNENIPASPPRKYKLGTSSIGTSGMVMNQPPQQAQQSFPYENQKSQYQQQNSLHPNNQSQQQNQNQSQSLVQQYNEQSQIPQTQHQSPQKITPLPKSSSTTPSTPNTQKMQTSISTIPNYSQSITDYSNITTASHQDNSYQVLPPLVRMGGMPTITTNDSGQITITTTQPSNTGLPPMMNTNNQFVSAISHQQLQQLQQMGFGGYMGSPNTNAIGANIHGFGNGFATPTSAYNIRYSNSSIGGNVPNNGLGNNAIMQNSTLSIPNSQMRGNVGVGNNQNNGISGNPTAGL